MKKLTLLLLVISLAGCTGTSPKGSARFDEFDAVTIEQMVGNNVSARPFQKTIICLNARRESREITALTNSLITSVTNHVVNAVTNQTVLVSTNLLYTSMTNLASALPPPPVVSGIEVDTNTVVVVVPPGASLSTNVTVSVASNSSGSVAPNQRLANIQVVRSFNNQLTTTSNNLSVALMTNLVVTAETNSVITYTTNISLVSVTNVIITPTNGLACDYFLSTEILAPPDFAPAQQGETLVLLVDGVRHAFATAQSSAAFVPRKGFTSTLYRVEPETLVAMANAKEIRLRIKGTTSVIEREMNGSSRQNFRAFVVKFFTPPPGTPDASQTVSETTRIANR